MIELCENGIELLRAKDFARGNLEVEDRVGSKKEAQAFKNIQLHSVYT